MGDHTKTADNDCSQARVINDTTEYGPFQIQVDEMISEDLATSKRFVDIKKRERRGIRIEQLKMFCYGKYKTLWRGMQIMKDALDCVIYQQLFWNEKPKTIIEIGAFSGANAVWMTDVMKAFNFPCHVYSLDIDLSLLHPTAKACKDVTFIEGDAAKIAESFPESKLKDLPHPWVVSEDAHVDLYGCMEHFHKYMEPGDYFIIEDTAPETPLLSGQGMIGDEYQYWGEKKLNILYEFMEKYGSYYAVDTFYTDFYGYNNTFNWNGYIKRMK